MKTIDKNFLKSIRTEINAALILVAAKHGVTLAAGNCRFTPTTATFKLELAMLGDGGVVVDKYAEAFKASAPLYGLEASDIGKTFTTGGKTYTLTGLDQTSRRFPIVGKSADGRTFKFTNEVVLWAFSKPVNSGSDQCAVI